MIPTEKEQNKLLIFNFYRQQTRIYLFLISCLEHLLIHRYLLLINHLTCKRKVPPFVSAGFIYGYWLYYFFLSASNWKDLVFSVTCISTKVNCTKYLKRKWSNSTRLEGCGKSKRTRNSEFSVLWPPSQPTSHFASFNKQILIILLNRHLVFLVIVEY